MLTGKFLDRKNGVVYTPMDAARQLADQVNLKGTVLDACCGTGNLIIAVTEARLIVGMSPQEIADKTFACDINPEAVEICRRRLVKLLGREVRQTIRRHVIVHDILESDPDFQ
jgi:methylase of polypeptide subunit release factors